MSFQDKIRRREAVKRGAASDQPQAQQPITVGDYVPATMLEAERATTLRVRQNAARVIKDQRARIDETDAMLRELLRMTAPATVPSYQGGHRAHVGNVHTKIRKHLEQVGALTPSTVRG